VDRTSDLHREAGGGRHSVAEPTLPTGGGVSTSPSTTDGSGGTGSTGGGRGIASPASSPGSALAFIGVDIERDAEIGAALIAGGWTMNYWASRQQARATHAASEAPEAGRSDPTV
jgi:hypothetical protein